MTFNVCNVAECNQDSNVKAFKSAYIIINLKQKTVSGTFQSSLKEFDSKSSIKITEQNTIQQNITKDYSFKNKNT